MNSEITNLLKSSSNIIDKDGETELFKAIRTKEIGFAKALINNGADVNICNIYQSSPLHLAACHGVAEIIPLLIEKGAKIEQKDKNSFTPLLEACNSPWSNAETIKALLDGGANINAKDNNDVTPLEHSISRLFTIGWYNSIEIVKILIENKADVHVKNCFGDTPLSSLKDFLKKKPDLDFCFKRDSFSFEKKAFSDDTEKFLRDFISVN
jgi:ankyrin repeat protein